MKNPIRVGGSLIAVALIVVSFAGIVRAEPGAERTELAAEMTTLFRSARAVISQEQSHINDAEVGDKGLSADVVVERMSAEYVKATGGELQLADAATVHGKMQTAMFESVRGVMESVQSIINEEGVGFKGLLPAVFAKTVADGFNKRMAGVASIKLTAPEALIRNKSNSPDSWENTVIATRFQSDDWANGEAFSETAAHDGQAAWRYMLPEYYAEGCLKCHGGPQGARDITGGLKEGGVLGQLGGAISLVLYE